MTFLFDMFWYKLLSCLQCNLNLDNFTPINSRQGDSMATVPGFYKTQFQVFRRRHNRLLSLSTGP